MKEYVRTLFEKMGYRVKPRKNLPKGTDKQLYSFELNNFSPIEVIFDVGANIGLTAIELSQNFPKAKIFSFEPVAATFEELKKNTKKLPNVNCFQTALGSEPGESVIYLSQNPQLNSLLPDVNNLLSNKLPHQEVTVKKIDQFCQEKNIHKIDILKTDTEGFDLNVIKGAEFFLKTSSISFILSEVGFNLSDKRHTNFFLMKSYLEEFRFEFLGIYDLSHEWKNGELMYANALFMNEDLKHARWQWVGEL